MKSFKSYDKATHENSDLFLVKYDNQKIPKDGEKIIIDGMKKTVVNTSRLFYTEGGTNIFHSIGIRVKKDAGSKPTK